MNKIAEMYIELCKEEIENLSPSEKQVVLNSLQDVKINSDLVDEYLTEASHGESDETMSITCGDFFKVVEYYQGNLCIACFLPSFREIFRSDCVGKVYQSHENADETEEDNDTDESGSEVDLGISINGFAMNYKWRMTPWTRSTRKSHRPRKVSLYPARSKSSTA